MTYKNRMNMENQKPKISLDQKINDCVNFLDDQKALDPYIHRFSSPNAIADAFIIVTATSRRHAQGMAEGMLRLCKEKGYEYLRMEGFDSAQWILVDCNDIIVHIFQADTRDLYRLEDLCRHDSAEEK